MKEDLSLLESRHWFGQFKFPNNSTDWFPGTLQYEPDKGLRLEYMLPFNPHTPSTNILFGVLQNGKLCTLYGNFSPVEGGMYFGAVTLHTGTRGFPFCIFGGHFHEKDLFIGIDTKFSNFQDFCFPAITRNRIPFSKAPLVDATCGDIRVQVINEGQFHIAPDGIASELHSDNENLITDLRETIKQTIAKHPNSFLYRRSSIEWWLRLHNETGMGPHSWLEQLYSFELLFSLLLFKPVRPIELRLRARNEKGQIQSFAIVGGVGGINSQTIAQIQDDNLHQQMPIKLQTIDLGSVVKRWFEAQQGYTLFASKLHDDFGDRVEHTTQTEYILLLAQLEGIAQKAGLDHKKRYEEAIQTFGSADLINQLLTLLGAKTLTDAASTLSDLRAEIAHLGRPRKLLSTIDHGKFIALNRSLDVIIASYIYQHLGITQQVIEEFRSQEVRYIQQFLNPSPLIKIVKKDEEITSK